MLKLDAVGVLITHALYFLSQQVPPLLNTLPNTPMQYTAIFHSDENVNFQMKNYNIFLIFAQILIMGTH